jgi:ribosomal protein S12 methylthiotransferase accessory factor
MFKASAPWESSATALLDDRPVILSSSERQRLDRILGLFDVLVDRKVGVIQRVTDLPLDHDDPEFFHYFSRACDTARFTPWSNFAHNGGASVHRAVAIAKALGEGVERYCAAIFRRDDLLLAPFKEVRQKATPPELFRVYRDDQFGQPGFPWQPFTDESPVHWTEGTSLMSGEPVLLPAAAVFIPFRYRAAEISTHVLQPISTGVACGPSFAEAAVAGLCEVIERDAFTITWQAMLRRPRLRVESLGGAAIGLCRRFERVGVHVHLMDITTDFGVPTVMTIGLGDTDASPALALSAAADPSPERAVIKSLEELAHTRKYAKQVMKYLPPIPPDVEHGHPLVVDQKEHLRFYCGQESKEYARFAWDSSERRDLAELPDLSRGDAPVQLAAIVDNIRAVGLDAIVCDLTTPDIRGLGLHVVRSVIPGAHPMYMGYKCRALAAPRLYEVPRRLGERGIAPGDADNPYPHPFP